jgi:hypothetical protein
MKKLGILTAVLLLASGISYASDDKTSIRGCLMQMGEDFILTDANGTKYEIDEMNAQLKDHLGHVVEIEGEMEGRSDDDKHEARKLDAKKIKMVSADCSSFNVASAGAPAATTTTTTTTTAGTTTAAGTVESDRDDDISGAEKASAAGSASQPEGSGMVTSGTTGPTTHVAGRVDPNTGATSTGTAGGTSVSPDATVAQSAPPDQKPFGQEQRTGEPATGTPEVKEGEARVDTDVNAAGTQTAAGDRATMGKKRDVRGCLTQVGDQFVLTEEGTGATYRLDGEHDKLRQHVNHTVSLKGEAEQLGETSGSGAKFEFDVEEVTMISAGCSAKSNAPPEGIEKN